jgi:hypothetical protein
MPDPAVDGPRRCLGTAAKAPGTGSRHRTQPRTPDGPDDHPPQAGRAGLKDADTRRRSGGAARRRGAGLQRGGGGGVRSGGGRRVAAPRRGAGLQRGARGGGAMARRGRAQSAGGRRAWGRTGGAERGRAQSAGADRGCGAGGGTRPDAPRPTLAQPGRCQGARTPLSHSFRFTARDNLRTIFRSLSARFVDRLSRSQPLAGSGPPVAKF